VGHSSWQNAKLENVDEVSDNRGMTSDIWTIEYFSCPGCGLPYTATREHHPDKHYGRFSCEVCGVKIHAWSGNYDFFDWKVDQAKSPSFGKRWG
jgi:predicted SprT family Zn-dependent metalloprotease